MIPSSSLSILTSVPDHLPNRTRSPTLRSIGISLPASSRPPGPTAVISPCDGFSFAVSGMMVPSSLLFGVDTLYRPADQVVKHTRSWSWNPFLKSSTCLKFFIFSARSHSSANCRAVGINWSRVFYEARFAESEDFHVFPGSQQPYPLGCGPTRRVRCHGRRSSPVPVRLVVMTSKFFF